MVVPARLVATTLPSATHLFVGQARLRAGHHIELVLGVWIALYVVAVAALLRAPREPSAAVSLLANVAIGIAAVARSPVLSDDLYRYAWDGRLQARGIDPYRFAPANPTLDRYHLSWLWPAPSICAAQNRPPGCTLINRPGVHTVYPPVAQLWFLLEHLVLPSSAHERGYMVIGLLVSLAVAIVLFAYLRGSQRDTRRIALWCCCPAVALEAVQSAHVDSVAALGVICAVWAAERGHLGRAAVALALAVLVKLYPLVLFPAMFRRQWLRAGAIVVGLVAVAYLPHVLVIGRGVTGFLHGYLSQEGYTSGSRFILLRMIGLRGRLATGFAVVLLVIIVAIAWRGRRRSTAVAATGVFTAVLFVVTPGEPWFELMLVGLVAMTGRWQWLGIIAAEYAGYLTFFYGGDYTTTVFISYSIALALGLGVTLRHRWRSGQASRRSRPFPRAAV
jgi:hypothetical protein